MEYIIRETTTTDFDAIMEVEVQAFDYDKEARLVANLLSDEVIFPPTRYQKKMKFIGWFNLSTG